MAKKDTLGCMGEKPIRRVRAKFVDDITGLTGPEEVFCQKMVEGLNATESYRLAFPKSAKWQTNTVCVRASILNSQHNVIERIQALRAQLRIYTGITLQEHTDNLARLRDHAVILEQMGPAVTAETNRGKVSGLYVEKVEHSGNVSIFASRQDEEL